MLAGALWGVAGGMQEVWNTGNFHVAFCEGQTVVLFRGPEPGIACPAWTEFLQQP